MKSKILDYLALTTCLFWSGLGWAATITVNNPGDVGAGTLRQAIADAASGDTIVFAITGVVAVVSRELVVTQRLAISGPGAGVLALSGNHSNRVFSIGSGAIVSIAGLTIQDGFAGYGPPVQPYDPGAKGGNGGGIYNQGVLTLCACVVSNNQAGPGGAGYWSPFDPRPGSAGGAGGDGGAIYNTGSLSLGACALCFNAAGSGGPGGNSTSPGQAGAGGYGGVGGAICSPGGLSLVACSLYNNASGRGGGGGTSNQVDGRGGAGGAGGAGGGIYCTGPLTMTNCILSGNYAGAGGSGGAANTFCYTCDGGDGGFGGSGGGVYGLGSIAAVNCTVARNSTATGGIGGSGGIGGNGGDSGHGGGLYSPLYPPPQGRPVFWNILAASNTIGPPGLAGSGGHGPNGLPGAAGRCPDLFGGFASQGHNLIGQISPLDGPYGFTNGISGDRAGSDASPLAPLIGPLTNNGGLTLSIALLPGSPAIDNGDDSVLAPTAALSTDHRGFSRKSGAHVDIGAFELQQLVFTDLRRMGSDIALRFASEFGRRYRIERGDDPASTNWLIAVDNVPGTGSTVQVLDPGAALQPQRFYRAVLLP